MHLTVVKLSIDIPKWKTLFFSLGSVNSLQWFNVSAAIQTFFSTLPTRCIHTNDAWVSGGFFMLTKKCFYFSCDVVIQLLIPNTCIFLCDSDVSSCTTLGCGISYLANFFFFFLPSLIYLYPLTFHSILSSTFTATDSFIPANF